MEGKRQVLPGSSVVDECRVVSGGVEEGVWEWMVNGWYAEVAKADANGMVVWGR